jgi:hypothetical protein
MFKRARQLSLPWSMKPVYIFSSYFFKIHVNCVILPFTFRGRHLLETLTGSYQVNKFKPTFSHCFLKMRFNIILPSTSSGEDSEEQIQYYHFSECSVMLVYRRKLWISHPNLLQIRVTEKEFSLFRSWGLMGGGRRVIAPFILNLGSRLWWLVNIMPPALSPWERPPVTHERRVGWVGPRASRDVLQNRKISLHCCDFNRAPFSTVQHIA